MKKIVILLILLINLNAFAQQAFVGDILCTDNSLESLENFASSGKTALGVIFFVDNTQQHGWAVALSDASVGEIEWGDDEINCYINSYENDPLRVATDTIGKIRCDSIENKAQTLGMSLDLFSGAVNAAIQTGDGWYLPAIGQLSILYSNITEINTALDEINGSRFFGERYWSCTEDNFGYRMAWTLEYDGGILARQKNELAKVRAIRNF